MSNEVRRIAVLSVYASPFARLGEGGNGGLNVYVREVCRALGEWGVATDVFTRVPEHNPECVEPFGPLTRLVQVPAGPTSADRYQLLDFVSAITQRIRTILSDRGNYDLLYSHDWLSGVVAGHLEEELNLPWAHTAHTWALLKNQYLAPGAKPEPGQRAFLESKIARGVDLLVVSTEEERDILEEAYEVERSRIKIIRPGVDLAVFNPRSRSEAKRSLGRDGEKLFVLAGRLERLKGVDLALEALAEVASDHPEATLVVIGADGGEVGEAERLRAMAAELGIAHQVTFCAPLPQPQLAQYYAAAEACLLPSYTESFGLVGLEAQACGTPLIVSASAGVASIVRDGKSAFVVAKADPSAYAQAMVRFLEVPGLADRMGAEGASLALDFSWQRTAQSFLRQMVRLGSP
jgi:D-inositol-3-phosphate glycosyltransferase